MSEKHSKINFWVGVYSLLILILCAIFIVFFLGKTNPFQGTITIFVKFHNVAGLKIGSNVTLEGYIIGRVVDIQIVEDKEGNPKYRVALKIVKNKNFLQWITSRSKFEIVNDNFFGDKHIEVGFGKGGTPLKDLAEVEGSQSPSLHEILLAIKGIVKNVEGTVKKVKATFASFEQKTEGNALTHLQSVLKDLAFLTRHLRQITQTTRREDLQVALRQMAVTSEKIGQVAENLQNFFEKNEKRLTQSIENLEKGMANFRSISELFKENLGGKEGQKILAKIKQAVDDFSKTSQNLAKLTQEMKSSLQTTRQQNVDLAKTMRDLQVGAENLRKITERILNTLDAPNRFFSRIFGRRKKKE